MDYQLGPGPLQVDQNTTDEKIKGDIGIVENGDIATHAILKDYYVIWKGNLYKAKSDISSGTTLSATGSGANLEPKSNGLGGEVAALSSKISDVDNRKSYFTLANMQQITDAYVTRNTYNGRKFSDYDLIAVTPSINGWVKGSSIVARAAFTKYTGMEIHTFVGSSPLEIDVKYVSDTSYDAKFIGSPGTSVYVFIYGIFAH